MRSSTLKLHCSAALGRHIDVRDAEAVGTLERIVMAVDRVPVRWTITRGADEITFAEAPIIAVGDPMVASD